MSLNLQMLNREEFVPEHEESYVAFIVDDFYGHVEFKNLDCEFHYVMIDADDGFPLPCTVIYKGDTLPFDAPLLFKDGEPYLIDEAMKHSRRNHADPEQRFWWVKTWMLCDRDHLQIHPETLEQTTLGVMKKKDFIEKIREANDFRVDKKQKSRYDAYNI